MAAAPVLRLLPRRRAATLAPLIPASMSSYSKPPYPLRAVTAGGGLPDVRRAQLCASPVPPMLRLYTSEGRQYSQHGAFMLWFLDKVINDLREQIEMMNEALEALEMAVHLLEHEADDKASFMFDQGMYHFLKANDICEKVLGDSIKAIGCCEDFTLATREHHILLCKEVEDRIKMLRQRLKKLSASFETVKMQRKHAMESIPAWMGSQGLEHV